jgi:acyl carrier protein
MDVRTDLKEVLAGQGFDTSELADDTDLREDLDIDSTALVEIAMVIERRLSLTIDAGKFQAVKTFADMSQFVEGRSAVAGGSPAARRD